MKQKGTSKIFHLIKPTEKKIALTADMVEIMVKAEIDGTEFRAIAKELRISVGRRMWCYMHSHQ